VVADNILDFDHEFFFFFNTAGIDNYDVASRMFVEITGVIVDKNL